MKWRNGQALIGLFALSLSVSLPGCKTLSPSNDRDDPLLKRPYKILIIGDSHFTGAPTDLNRKFATTSPGLALDEKLRRVPLLEVDMVGICGATADDYFYGREGQCGGIIRNPKSTQSAPYSQKMKAPKLSDLLAQYKPDALVIALGAHYVNWMQEKLASQSILRLLSTIEPQKIGCLWLGPPNMRAYPRYYTPEQTYVRQTKTEELIASTIEGQFNVKCEYIGTDHFTTYPATGGDGFHYQSLGPVGAEYANEWGEVACENITRELFKRVPLECHDRIWDKQVEPPALYNPRVPKQNQIYNYTPPPPP